MSVYFVIEDYGYYQDVIGECSSYERAKSIVDINLAEASRNSFIIVKAVKRFEPEY